MHSSGLFHQWVVAGMVSAAARFLPVPLVDDFVRDRSRQFAIAQTLKAHGRRYESKQLQAYYGNPQGCVAGCVGFVLWLPVRLLLFPIRKIVSLVTAVHGVPMDLLKTVLLARTLDRCLERGMLLDLDSSETAPTDRAKQILQMRFAFDAAMQGMDWKVAKNSIEEVLKRSSGWRQAAVSLAMQTFRSHQVPDQLPEELTDREQATEPQLDQGADQIEAVLSSPESMQWLQQFDERFDATLSEMISNDAGTADD